MRKLPPLNGLKAFEATGRHLTFRLAAEELGVTHGAVAQQVRGLESFLGVELFERQARGLALTDAGRKYLPPIRRAFVLMEDASSDLQPGPTVIAISATPSFATKWLVPRLGEFSTVYPDIRLRLDASNTLANFQSDGIDIAIRLAQPPFPSGLVATQLLSSELIAVCHPRFLEGADAILTVEDLALHTLLQDTHGLWPTFLEQAFVGAPVPNMRTMNFSQTSLAIDAAIAGQGLALTSPALVEADLHSGRLCEPLPLRITTAEAYYVVHPRRPRNRALVEAVTEWLVSNKPTGSSV